MKFRWFIIAIALCAPTLLGVDGSRAQAQSPAAGGSRVETLNLAVNKSYLVEFQTDVDDIIIANPAIANVTARDSRRIAVMGLSAGASNIMFIDRAGKTLLTLEVSVTNGVAGVSQLRDLLDRYIPGNRLEVEEVNGRIILAGSVKDASSASRAVMLARPYVKDDASIINMIAIEGKDQVALKVRILEMQRSIIKQLGVDLGGGVSFGEFLPRQFDSALNPLTGLRELTGLIAGAASENLYQFGSASGFGVSGTPLGGLTANLGYQNFVGGAARDSVSAGLTALEKVGLVRTLAEPNLTAISGESAKFLAGGEFPVAVAQEEGKISVEFKPYGVGLGFTPVVLSEGRISLQISTEVSELTQQGAFQSRTPSYRDPATGELVAGEAIILPALKVRRAETVVELPSGGSLVIAGLIQEQTKQSLEGVPGAKDIPVLGSLFRSRDFLNDETELVVFVTPYLVEPTDPQKLRSPEGGFVSSRDARTIFFGKLNDVYGVPGAVSGEGLVPKGASGFIFD